MMTFLVLTLLSATPIEEKAEASLEQRTRQAVERGVDFLIERQLSDGSFAGWCGGYDGGITAFVTYALLRAGLPSDHPSIVRALACLATKEPQKVYNASSLLLALGATGQAEHVPRMRELTAQLIDWMPSTGLYDYPGQYEDLSNTLFAALALDMAAERGIRVKNEVWRGFIRGTLSCEAKARRIQQDGVKSLETGFAYRPRSEASGSMVAAGLTILEIARRRLDNRVPGSDRESMRRATESSMRWLANHYTLSKNPPNRSWHYFHVWGYERVGALFETDTIGTHDWYREGAEYLLEHQKKAGNWYKDLAPSAYDPKTYDANGEQLSELRTCMALLFLRRATASSNTKPLGTRTYATEPVEDAAGLRAAGDTPIAFWLDPLPDAVARVEYLARPAGSEDAAVAIGSSNDRAASFPIRHEFDRVGDFEVWARAFDAEGAEHRTASLEISIAEVLEPRYLDYIRQGERNVARFDASGVTASSEAKGRGRTQAFDRRLGTFWQCAPEDVEPWIDAELEEPVLADRVWITPARPRRATIGIARAKSLEIVLNRRRRYDVLMPPNPDAKAVLELPKALRIRSVRVRILDAYDGEVGAACLGVSEVELLREGR